MTCMKKEEVKMLAQATAIVDKLLVPIANEDLLKAATPSFVGFDKGAYSDFITNLSYEPKDLHDSTVSSVMAKYYNDIYKLEMGSFNTFHQDLYTRTVTKITPEFDQKCKEIFQKAFDIIKDEKFWCQGELAREVRVYKHEPVKIDYYSNALEMPEIRTEVGYQFCSIGAILHGEGEEGKNLHNRTYSHRPSKHAQYVMTTLCKYMGGDIVKYNDNMGHRYVVSAWKNCGEANGWL